jgi:hypothetical protein
VVARDISTTRKLVLPHIDRIKFFLPRPSELLHLFAVHGATLDGARRSGKALKCNIDPVTWRQGHIGTINAPQPTTSHHVALLPLLTTDEVTITSHPRSGTTCEWRAHAARVCK